MSKSKPMDEFEQLRKKLLEFTEKSLNKGKSAHRGFGLFHKSPKSDKNLENTINHQYSINETPDPEQLQKLLLQTIHEGLIGMKHSDNKEAHLKGLIPHVESALNLSIKIKQDIKPDFKLDLKEVQNLQDDIAKFKSNSEREHTMPRYR